MNNEAEARSLTLNDPVDPETLEQFRQLQDARQRFAETLLSLEQDKIQLLAAVKKIDDQLNRLFQACSIERGLPPQTRIEIDARSGKVTRMEEAPSPVRVQIPV